jgi:hypothetical protein
MFNGLQQFLAPEKYPWRWAGQFALRVGWSLIICAFVVLVLLGGSLNLSGAAWASIQDDRFDGNIFALYAGNGSLVPPKVTLAQSLKGERPTILTFYIEDSKDCKQFSARVSQLQAYYGRAVDILPINVDSIPVQTSYTPNELGYYYTGQVPQTIIFNADGEKVLDVIGKASFEQFDDILRGIFNLLPREDSLTLKRRPLNEVNAELN